MVFHRIQVGFFCFDCGEMGIGDRGGSWDLDPYLSFGLSALVELIGYIVVHAILDRIGRKIPYCTFVILFSIFAILVLPVQYLMDKDGRGLPLEITNTVLHS